MAIATDLLLHAPPISVIVHDGLVLCVLQLVRLFLYRQLDDAPARRLPPADDVTSMQSHGPP